MDGEAILVGHHQNLYGPLIAALYLPDTTRIWALSSFFSFKDCFDLYYGFTFTKRFKMNRFKAAILAFFAAIIVPQVMKSARAIPVHRKSNRIKETYKKTMNALEQGYQIMIFPDVDYSNEEDCIKEIYTGFIKIDQNYYKNKEEHLPFVPLCFHKGKDYVTVGKSLYYEKENWVFEERETFGVKIIDGINRLVSTKYLETLHL